jgi:hypothetical protein
MRGNIIRPCPFKEGSPCLNETCLESDVPECTISIEGIAQDWVKAEETNNYTGTGGMQDLVQRANSIAANLEIYTDVFIDAIEAKASLLRKQKGMGPTQIYPPQTPEE